MVLPELVNSGYVFTALGRIGMMVCYDLEFPEWVRSAGLAGADLLAVSTNWPASPVPAGERPVLTDGPAVLTADCDLARARDKATGRRNDVHRDRRTDLYRRSTWPTI